MSSTPKTTGTKRSAPDAPKTNKTKKARLELEIDDANSNKKSLEYEDPSQSPRYSPPTLEDDMYHYDTLIQRIEKLKQAQETHLSNMMSFDSTTIFPSSWQEDRVLKSINETAKLILALKFDIYRLRTEKNITRIQHVFGGPFETDMLKTFRLHVSGDKPFEPTSKQVDEYLQKWPRLE